MQNPIDFALTEVAHNIPPDVLRVARLTYNSRTGKSISSSSAFIADVIIEQRVLKHCNLSSGLIKTIALRPAWIEDVRAEHEGYAGDDGQYTTFRIPPEYRDNKPITNILSCQFPHHTYTGTGVGDANFNVGGYTLIDQIDEILNSYTLANPRNHPTARLLAGDLVKLCPSQYAIQNWLLTCRIAFDKNFTSLHESAIEVLAKLVVLATKQWCYINLLIQIDRAVVESGMDIGAFRSVVESYSDAGQQFEETMVLWRGVANLDPETRRRLLMYQI